MSTFRNHRVLIASLFLPNTAVLGESTPPTPERPLNDVEDSLLSAAAISQRLKEKRLTTLEPRSATITGPLKSIVDDLKDKSSRIPTPSAHSPAQEKGNPFSKLNLSSTDAPPHPTSDASDGTATAKSPRSQTISPPPSRKYQTTHAEHTAPRLRRKHSRSSSRRSADDLHHHHHHHYHHHSNSGRFSRRGVSSPHLIEPWHVELNPHCNGGLKNAVDSIGERLRKVWVGTVGTKTDTFSDALRNDIDHRMLAEYASLPVWIPDAEFEGCYDDFCHQVLWPALHYAIPDAPKTKFFYESASYKHYVAVNQRFADAIIANYREGDIIWVNDYHLMLLPALLRASPQIPPTAPIGFFMHVAFPSSEIFRCLSVRQDLLRGLLGADLVGFQTANYARHFRQTVSRIMAYESLPKGIQVADADTAATGSSKKVSGLPGILAGEPKESAELSGDQKHPDHTNGARGRFVDVGVFPMGIDVMRLREKRADPEVQEWVQVLKGRYSGMKILVGRDKLDEVQGVRHKVQAFEMFLEKYPEFQGKVVLIQVALQTTEPNEQSSRVADLVSRVNSRFSTLTYQPVVFLHTQDLTFTQYLALLTVADAFIVTSLREGMALRTHEYVECQEGKGRPLILSEFTGSYSYSGFRSCIAVNPWDTRSTAAAINQALTMPDEEAFSRWEDLHNHVITHAAQTFVTSFLNRCLRAHTEHIQEDAFYALTLADADGLEGDREHKLTFLDLGRVMPRYKHAWHRLVLVDFEGTLFRRDLSKDGLTRWAEAEKRLINIGAASAVKGADDENAPKTTESTDQIIALEHFVPADALNVLENLVDDRRNEVWLLSGLKIRGVLEKVAERIPEIGIVAENGCFIKMPKTRNSVSPYGDWLNMVANFNMTWKSSCLEILNYFTERTPSSFIEMRDASVVWRFWTGDVNDEDSADRQWARRQAAEAQNHIFDSLGERYGLRIIPGKNSFLVLPSNVSRSTAVGAILHPGGPSRSALGGRTAFLTSPLVEFGQPYPSMSISSSIHSILESISNTHSHAHPHSHSHLHQQHDRRRDSHNSERETSPSPSSEGELDFALAISSDEKLLRRLGELEFAETVSTKVSASGLVFRGTDARWRLEPGDKVVAALQAFANVSLGAGGAK